MTEVSSTLDFVGIFKMPNLTLKKSRPRQKKVVWRCGTIKK
jgi:hypothetical protein